jgi:predicted AlkP superfamily phosphohydrolase/phosphomutase/tetratricopeptide (TPR) repeat protein
MNKPSKNVLLLGWDAADWKIINRLIDNGEMPALKSLIENGVMGNISTLNPPLSPMLWTSIATGKYADKHGILGFSEPTPDHSGIRPVSTSSRKVKAIWNILTQNGCKTHVINWWPSYPVEPVNGIYVSDMFPKAGTTNIKKWKLPDGAVHPADLQNVFSHFRVHPLELTTNQIAPFIPLIETKTVGLSKKIITINRLIAEAASIQAAATLALDQEEWDFAAIYWCTIDHFCHGFMNYTPPQMKGIKDEDYELYKHAVDGAYRLMDMMLANLMELAGEDCTIIITSDHGFQSGDLRKSYTPTEPAGPAFHHRNVGVFCAKGPGIKKDEIIYGATLLDITPTILSIMGIPIGKDMDGKPLIEIFEQTPEIRTIPSWEDVQGECGMLPEDKRELDPDQSAKAIKQLIDLGYIEDPGPNITKAVEWSTNELNYNLAVVYYSTNRRYLAQPILEELFKKYPHRGRYLFKLVDCYLDKGDLTSADLAIEKFRTSAEKKILSKKEIESIIKRKVPEILSEKEKKMWHLENKRQPIKDSYQALNDLLQLKITEADILFKQGKPKRALHKYKEIEKQIPKSQSYNYQLGRAFLKTRDWKEAERKFSEVLLHDPDHSNAHLGLGICKFNKGKYEEALDSFLTSVSLDFYNPGSHFNVGRTMKELGDYEKAATSFEISLRIDPNFGLARNAIIDLYSTVLKDPVKAALYKINPDQDIQTPEVNKFDDDTLIIKPKSVVFSSTPVIIVSGLPRSGTSMVMQMLDAGGVPIFTDDERKADENNPKGYYEHAKVKQLIRNTRWLGEAAGKAVKIVLPLLYKIPASYNYNVIFILRDMDEIIESQHKMLVNRGMIKESGYAAGIDITYRSYLEKLKKWSLKNKNVNLLLINYKQTIENPESVAKEISNFLNLEMDIMKMVNTVLPELYRTKLG